MSGDTEASRIDRAKRAETALSEFLVPAFSVVRAEYQTRLVHLADNEPWAADKIRKLASAFRIASEVEAQIKSLVQDGAVAERDLHYARKIEKIPTERRKILGI